MDVLIVMGVLSAVMATFFLWTGYRSLKRATPYRGWLALSTVAVMATVGFGVAAVLVGKAEYAAEARQHEQFVEQVRPVVSELERLGLKPSSDGFYDEDSYRLLEPGKLDIGMVAVQNDRGRLIWVGYEIKNNRVAVGCFVEGKVYPTTPAGAIQLRGSKGCEPGQ